MTTYNIYRGTQLVAQVKGLSGHQAWRAARKAVRTGAHDDGVEGMEQIFSTAGRPGTVSRGIYRACLELRVDL